MARLQIAPTKSNLLALKDQLAVAQNGYDLLEQKREILVMELMKMVEKVKLLEQDIEKQIEIAYPSLRRMFIAVGRNQTERIAQTAKYQFDLSEKTVFIAGMHFSTLDVELPKRKLNYSYLNTFADCDKVMVDFFELLRLLTEMASIRTIVWRLAREVKKTQRRVNALDKQIIPKTQETKVYIESILEERERENVFVLKALKAKKERRFDEQAN
ncbi:V-type ATP synthase subunit D [Treponema phagedenis]|uniref:V-type ATP synthase subunit D n=1 Tax=Treponema phagedenis TaxID=162 RepID=A0A0B7GTZ9_TREPH|nr:V-type ATP synthase subunit D [Treponema phagedenis]NVP22753.1 V-type ATP synthase subunit D [Treponema phagedenis]QEJ98398.1 V-type ATP synthase subunit D [Treponema phagedenis]QEK01147.1 V-type ATP synthase subunit D [Treponema phagedenis]QEK03906.1 V-type ATP synthase subunit D [Treponema phagedenis]QEK06155.1 V-type ATP synthase subunit D [Treponema phagedenis]